MGCCNSKSAAIESGEQNKGKGKEALPSADSNKGKEKDIQPVENNNGIEKDKGKGPVSTADVTVVVQSEPEKV